MSDTQHRGLVSWRPLAQWSREDFGYLRLSGLLAVMLCAVLALTRQTETHISVAWMVNSAAFIVVAVALTKTLRDDGEYNDTDASDGLDAALAIAVVLWVAGNLETLNGIAYLLGALSRQVSQPELFQTLAWMVGTMLYSLGMARLVLDAWSLNLSAALGWGFALQNKANVLAVTVAGALLLSGLTAT